MAGKWMKDYRYILMKDGVGEVDKSAMGALRKLVQKRQVNILRGELLFSDQNLVHIQQRDDETRAQQFRLERDNSIVIYCAEDDVAPLSHVDYKLLQAIESPTDRYATFSAENKLEWGQNFKNGDQVYVRVGETDWSLAVVRYKGPVKGLPGTIFGMEIMDAHYHGRGTTDGWFRNKYYFQCNQYCGLFVSLDKLSFQSPHTYHPSSNHGPGKQSQGNGKQPYAERVESEHDHPDNINVDVPKINDRVIVYSREGIPIHGTVRWAGRDTGFRKLNFLHVGIETDVTVYGSEFAESVLVMGQLFPAQRHHRLVVPASMVIKEEGRDDSCPLQEHPPDRPFYRPTPRQRNTTKQDRVNKDLDNPLQVAQREFNMTQAEDMAKKSERYEQLKEAVGMGGETITAAEQQRILDMIMREKGDQQSSGNRTQHPGSNDSKPLSVRVEGGQQLLKQRSWQPKLHMYDPIPGEEIPTTQHRFDEEGTHTSVNIAKGEGLQKTDAQECFQQLGTQQPVQPDNYLYNSSGQQWQECRHLHQQPDWQDLPPPIQLPSPMGSSHGARGVAASTVPVPTSELGVGSMIQLPSTHPPQYGVIQWVGEFPGVQSCIAGIEMDVYMDGGTDGTWHGQKLFDCPNGKGMFYPLCNLRPDERFLAPSSPSSSAGVDHQFSTKDLSPTHRLQEKDSGLGELRRQLNQLQTSLDVARNESSQLRQQLQLLEEQRQQEQREARLTQLQVPPQGPDSWNVPRNQVDIREQIGSGAWGIVSKGYFRDQSVAIKQAHQAILNQPYTIRDLKREIQIMTHVQHPNLVRFIAAVIDEQVERGEDTPLLIVELLDINLRQAYRGSNLGNNTVPIFRDVAYGLHYLHEHAVPIIHRDVSAPNVLLEKLPGGMYRAKLSDFGSAEKAKDVTTLGTGAIGYSAPETFPREDMKAPLPPQTPKIDVFSYGILLAEVITKTMPTAEIRLRLVRQVEGKWKEMYELISSCTKPVPSDRLTMTDVLNKLNRIPNPRP